MEALRSVPPRPSWLRRPAVLAALLFALTFGLYARTRGFEFVNYDDDLYVTKNEHVLGGLSAADVRWAFTTGHAGNWHPLTWLAHQLDVELFALDAGAHHRTSAFLHALNAALLLLALYALTRRLVPSALVAALFAWHPLRVECAAWIAERKELLSAGFTFATLLAYAGYARRGGRARYGLALALFGLGLLAKPMGVTTPFVLLLLDYWPLARHAVPEGRSFGRLALEKLPFLALAAGSALVTLLVQRAGGALGDFAALDAGARLANAFRAYGVYAWKTLWPSGLCVFHLHPSYAHPEASPWSAGVFAALAFLVLASVVLVRERRRAPYALVGWLWFLGTLVPVIGLVQVGWQGWAERYAYVPTIGLVLATVFGAAELARTPVARRVAGATAALGLVALAAQTWIQVGTWRDSRTLFERALAVEENTVAHTNLGVALEQQHDLEGARAHYARALEFYEPLPGVHVNLARVLTALGRTDEARKELERALQQDPDHPRAHADLGLLLANGGRDAAAAEHLRRARELGIDEEPVHNVLAWILATSATVAAPKEALEMVEPLCARPDVLPVTLETRAAALARLGRFPEAIEWQQRALLLAPSRNASERLELYKKSQPYVRTP